MKKTKVNCPDCGRDKTLKNGLDPTSKNQRYCCNNNDCATKNFTMKAGTVIRSVKVLGVVGSLKFKTPEILAELVDDYFEYQKKRKRPFTISGLALWLGVSHKTIMNYSKKESYAGIIAYAKLKVMNYLEEKSLTVRFPAAYIFNLKANFGFQDRVEVEHNGNVSILFDKDDAKLCGEDC